jgi:hypothetical protein
MKNNAPKSTGNNRCSMGFCFEQYGGNKRRAGVVTSIEMDIALVLRQIIKAMWMIRRGSRRQANPQLRKTVIGNVSLPRLLIEPGSRTRRRYFLLLRLGNCSCVALPPESVQSINVQRNASRMPFIPALLRKPSLVFALRAIRLAVQICSRQICRFRWRLPEGTSHSLRHRAASLPLPFEQVGSAGPTDDPPFRSHHSPMRRNHWYFPPCCWYSIGRLMRFRYGNALTDFNVWIIL